MLSGFKTSEGFWRSIFQIDPPALLEARSLCRPLLAAVTPQPQKGPTLPHREFLYTTRKWSKSVNLQATTALQQHAWQLLPTWDQSAATSQRSEVVFCCNKKKNRNNNNNDWTCRKVTSFCIYQPLKHFLVSVVSVHLFYYLSLPVRSVPPPSSLRPCSWQTQTCFTTDPAAFSSLSVCSLILE